MKEYPGRDSNPHATKAVALKATVSDQFHHPGGDRQRTDSRRWFQALRDSSGRRFPIDFETERLLGSVADCVARRLRGRRRRTSIE